METVFRPGTAEDDRVIARHFYQLWLDNGLTPGDIKADWETDTLQFIAQARETLAYQAFIAEVQGVIVGSAGCQFFAGLYPVPFQPHYRQDGYIWNVYVDPRHRQQGIGRTLTQRCLDYLQSIGCTRAVLNASLTGKPVYEQLGFQPHNSMWRAL